MLLSARRRRVFNARRALISICAIGYGQQTCSEESRPKPPQFRRCNLAHVAAQDADGVYWFVVQTWQHMKQIRGSIVVSIFACHAEDPGSIPGRGVW